MTQTDFEKITIQDIEPIIITGTRTKVYTHIVLPFVDALKNTNTMIVIYDAHKPRIDVITTRECIVTYHIDAILNLCKNEYKQMQRGTPLCYCLRFSIEVKADATNI